MVWQVVKDSSGNTVAAKAYNQGRAVRLFAVAMGFLAIVGVFMSAQALLAGEWLPGVPMLPVSVALFVWMWSIFFSKGRQELHFQSGLIIWEHTTWPFKTSVEKYNFHDGLYLFVDEKHDPGDEDMGGSSVVCVDLVKGPSRQMQIGLVSLSRQSNRQRDAQMWNELKSFIEMIVENGWGQYLYINKRGISNSVYKHLADKVVLR